MKRVMLILMLVVCLAGCKDKPQDDTYTVTSYYNGKPVESVIDRITGRNINYDWGKTAEAADIVFSDAVSEPNLVWAADDAVSELMIISDEIMGYDISIALGGGEMLFTTTDGKFDVIFDPNKCTENAAAFAKCMETMMPGYIMSVAKDLEGVKEDE